MNADKIRELSRRIRAANEKAYEAIMEANRIRDAALAKAQAEIIAAVTEAGEQFISLEQLYV